MKTLFLDESGDHNLGVIDNNYPIFVLAGCVLDKKCHDEKLWNADEHYKKLTDVYES